MRKTAIVIAAAAIVLAGAASTFAATPLSVRDSWRIGSSGTSFCSAQSLTTDKALSGMFDGGYSITCRDAALPVGKLTGYATSPAQPTGSPPTVHYSPIADPRSGKTYPGSVRSMWSNASSRTPTSLTAVISFGAASFCMPHKALRAMTARCSLACVSALG